MRSSATHLEQRDEHGQHSLLLRQAAAQLGDYALQVSACGVRQHMWQRETLCRASERSAVRLHPPPPQMLPGTMTRKLSCVSTHMHTYVWVGRSPLRQRGQGPRMWAHLAHTPVPAPESLSPARAHRGHASVVAYARLCKSLPGRRSLSSAPTRQQVPPWAGAWGAAALAVAHCRRRQPFCVSVIPIKQALRCKHAGLLLTTNAA